MVRLRDLGLVAGLAGALVVGVGAYRLLAGDAGLGEVLLAAPGIALAAGLAVGAATVGYRGRSRTAAVLGGVAGAGLAGLHAGLAASFDVASVPVLAAAGLASGLAAYLVYLAIIPPQPQGAEPPDP